METHTVDETLLQVRELLEKEDVNGAIKVLESFLPPDRADIFEGLDPEYQETLLPQLDAENAADILQDMENEDAAELAARLGSDALAPILDEMEPDEAADLLGDLEPDLAVATLAQMSEPDEVRPLLLHADETAGGLMTSEYLAFPQNMRAERVLTAVREWEPKRPEAPYLFVVDDRERLVGVANLFQVIRADPPERLSSLMDPGVIKVLVSDDQEVAAYLMARYDLAAIPVVDDTNRLVGVITVDDLVEVLENEATEDIQRIGGSQPLARPYLDTSIFQAVWKRLGWLLLLFVTGTLTLSVMRLYQDQLDRVITLALFVPLLIGTGGNAGSQTTATIIRALSVGDIGTADTRRVLWREIRTSLLLGGLLAVVALVRAVTWNTATPVAVVVASSIFSIVIWANCVGALLPLVAARLKVDPALVSGPLMSTLVDATGLFIYFTVAGIVLGT